MLVEALLTQTNILFEFAFSFLRLAVIGLIVAMFSLIGAMMSYTTPTEPIYVHCYFLNTKEHGLSCDMEGHPILKYNMMNWPIQIFGSQNIIDQVQSLKIFKADFEVMPETLLSMFVGLQRLEIHNTTLQSINRKMFNGAENLREIILTDNKIGFLDPNTFENLTELEVLNLEGNEIEFLSKNLFTNNRKLKFLDLSNNKINMIEESFGSNLKNVEIDLSDNKCVLQADLELDLENCYKNAKNSENLKSHNDKVESFKEKIRLFEESNAIEITKTNDGLFSSFIAFCKLAYMFGVIIYMGYNLQHKLINAPKKRKVED